MTKNQLSKILDMEITDLAPEDAIKLYKETIQSLLNFIADQMNEATLHKEFFVKWLKEGDTNG